MAEPQINQNLLYLATGIVVGGAYYWLLNKFWGYKRSKHDTYRGIIYMQDEGDKSIFNDVTVYKSLIRQVPQDTQIKLIITTYGGSYYKCLSLLHYLKQHRAGYAVYVNKHCESAGTCLALGAQEIIMDNYSHLTKIDPQLDDASSIHYEKVFNKMSKESLNGKFMLKVYRSLNWLNYLEEELKKLISQDLYGKVKDELIYSDNPHCKCYYYDDCVKLGLPVREPNNEELIYFT